MCVLRRFNARALSLFYNGVYRFVCVCVCFCARGGPARLQYGALSQRVFSMRVCPEHGCKERPVLFAAVVSFDAVTFFLCAMLHVFLSVFFFSFSFDVPFFYFPCLRSSFPSWGSTIFPKNKQARKRDSCHVVRRKQRRLRHSVSCVVVSEWCAHSASFYFSRSKINGTRRTRRGSQNALLRIIFFIQTHFHFLFSLFLFGYTVESQYPLSPPLPPSQTDVSYWHEWARLTVKREKLRERSTTQFLCEYRCVCVCVCMHTF